MVIFLESIVPFGHGIDGLSVFDSNDIDVVLLADIDVDDGLADPVWDNRNFKN